MATNEATPAPRGRPRSSRRAFERKLMQDFENHGEKVIASLRDEHLLQYMSLVETFARWQHELDLRRMAAKRAVSTPRPGVAAPPPPLFALSEEERRARAARLDAMRESMRNEADDAR